MVVVNFAHPLTDTQKSQVEALAGRQVERVVVVPTEFDESRSFVEQARSLIDAAGLTETEWQTLPLVINVPSMNTIAALVLAEIHGRAGYFPAILRLRATPASAVHEFEVAEILDLQRVRDVARERRKA